MKNYSDFDPFAGPEIGRVLHTTEAQMEIWTACKIGGINANRAYNESISLVFKGNLNKDSMDEAVQTIVERHESLRAVFSTDGKFMSIFKHLQIGLRYEDVSNFAEADRNNSIASIIEGEADYIFNLVHGSLFRATLIKIADLEYHLVLTAHHIICDGWSLGVLMQELGLLYSASVENINPNLPNPSRFSAYADSQELLLKSDEYYNIEHFWLKRYEHSIPELNLPIDYPRQSTRTYKSQRLDFPLDSNILSGLKRIGSQAGCSLVTTILGAFEVFLYQLTGQNDIVVGLPAAGQSATGKTHLVGHCANLLPLRSSINSNVSFTEYLNQRKLELYDAYDHQQLSFGQLLKKLNTSRDPSRVPLVPVVFNMDVGLTNGIAFSGLEYTLISNPRKYEIFELFINASGTNDKLVLEWSFNTDLFKTATIRQMMTSFEDLLDEIVRGADKKMSRIIIENDLYESLNETYANFPTKPLHKLLEDQAITTPQRIALKFNDIEISYRNLNDQANQLANYFHRRGLRPNDLMGVCIPRCPEMLVTLIAIMKCGAAYLPMDPEYPEERLEFMLQDSEAKFLMTTNKFSSSLSVVNEIFYLDEAFASMEQFPKSELEHEVSQDSVVYLLYTSGSTGKPKGVQITHRNLVNVLFGIDSELAINKEDKLLAITTISFDIAGVELYLPLLKGACVVLGDSETTRDPNLILDLVEKEAITILQATPTTWQMLLDTNRNNALFNLKAITAGEKLTANIASSLLVSCKSLWNLYGPTETTIYSSLKHILSANEPISIGRPIANTQIYILNEKLELVPPGVVGEIVVGGEGVATGYWKRAGLNAEKFIKDPFCNSGNSRLYRSGDLGKLLPNGEIHCLGRVDNQIKVRGHRIEPGEIEQILNGMEDVKTAAVTAYDSCLVAHVVPIKMLEDNSEQIGHWRNCLASSLPAYLVPDLFRISHALPTTPNGKLDRKALIEESITEKSYSRKNIKPRNQTEELISTIWQECLNIENIDVTSNFFELGGHSLMAVQVVSRLEKQLGKRFPVALLFEYSTIEKLAKFVDTKDVTSFTGDSLLTINSSGSKIPLYFIHGVGYNALKFKNLSAQLHSDQPVYGLQGTGVTASGTTLDSVEKIAAHYISAIKKINPDGPYSLAGHSYGGIIAYEMASQFKHYGDKVEKLIMLDSDIDNVFFHKTLVKKQIASITNTAGKMVFTLKQMSKSKAKFDFYFNRKKDKVIKQYFSKYAENKNQIIEEQQILRIEEQNNRMIRKYHIKPQLIEVDLLRAVNNIDYMRDPVSLGWKDLALNGLKVHDVTGDHLSMLLPPNDIVTAKILQDILDR
ncbi:non-ribosomal peptide synthetase [Christiangramia sp. LLG6405-1]|uniref:non-ribosomal peptide synthetase n=1 Tax=Christiangramia sp. LLG6405-1 TaxID=3160832 RepID=UPI0038667FCB